MRSAVKSAASGEQSPRGRSGAGPSSWSRGLPDVQRPLGRGVPRHVEGSGFRAEEWSQVSSRGARPPASSSGVVAAGSPMMTRQTFGLPISRVPAPVSESPGVIAGAGTEVAREHPHERRPGGRCELADRRPVRPARAGRDRGRRAGAAAGGHGAGYGKGAWAGLDSAAANGAGRRDQPRHTKRRGVRAQADHIDDRVERAHLVKCTYPRSCRERGPRREPASQRRRALGRERPSRQGCTRQQRADVAQAAGGRHGRGTHPHHDGGDAAESPPARCTAGPRRSVTAKFKPGVWR